MYEMSSYSTPILWSASVAGPVKGEVVASWRNTSRNRVSSGVSIRMSRPAVLGSLIGVCLQDFLKSPVVRVLNSSPGRCNIALKRSSRRHGLRGSPLRRLVRVASEEGDALRRWPDLSLPEWVRTRLVPWIAPWMFRLTPVRRFVFRTVSQIGVNYRNSPLSVGAAGTVRGGDRLPWVETETEGDNFASLASLTWQVHVYGEPRLGLAEVCAELQLPLHLFPWKPEMRRAGLLRDAVYLVRPDGYVGLADPHADPERLRDYLRAHGLGDSLRAAARSCNHPGR